MKYLTSVSRLLCLSTAAATALVAAGAAQAAPRKKRAPSAAPAAKAARPAPAPKPVHPGPAWSVAFSPDGKRIAVGGYKRVVLYAADTGEKLAQWPVVSDAVRSLTFSPDGRYLAAGTGVPAKSGGVVVYNAATGKPARIVTGHYDTVEAVAFSGTTVLSAGNDEKVRLTDLGSGKPLGVLSDHVGRCLAVAVPTKTSDADGGEIFVTGAADNTVKVWDAKTRRVVVNFDQCASPVWSLAFLPRAGQFVAAAADGKLRWFGVRADPDGKAGDGQREGYLSRTIDAHPGGVYAVAVAPDGKRLVSGGADKKLNVWNEGGGRHKQMADAAGDIYGVAVSPDSKLVAAASSDGKTRVYAMEDGKLLLQLPGGIPGMEPPGPPPVVLNGLKPGSGTGLRGRYFSNVTLEGPPALTRVDTGIDLDLNTNGPGGGLAQQNISVRWEGYVEAPVSGTYTFYTRTDDGARLWVNGRQLVDAWVDRAVTEDAGAPTFDLKAGQRVPIRFEFYQGAGGGEAHLLWSYPGQDKQTIPANRLYPFTADQIPGTRPKPRKAPSPRVTKR